MTEATVETVFLARKSACYHTDQECPRLNPAERITEKPRAVLAADAALCEFCSGEYTPSPPDFTLPRLLGELDPDDVS